MASVVERLHSKMVTRQKQLWPARAFILSLAPAKQSQWRDQEVRLHIGMWPSAERSKDGKAVAAHANVGTVRESSLPQTRVVGTTVRLDVRHPSEHFPVPTVGESGDPTHD